MQVIKTTRKAKCSGKVDCDNLTSIQIKYSKYTVRLCDKCANELYSELSKILVPKSVKSKFNN